MMVLEQPWMQQQGQVTQWCAGTFRQQSQVISGDSHTCWGQTGNDARQALLLVMTVLGAQERGAFSLQALLSLHHAPAGCYLGCCHRGSALFGQGTQHHPQGVWDCPMGHWRCATAPSLGPAQAPAWRASWCVSGSPHHTGYSSHPFISSS